MKPKTSLDSVLRDAASINYHFSQFALHYSAYNNSLQSLDDAVNRYNETADVKISIEIIKDTIHIKESDHEIYIPGYTPEV
jgi:hypothetical protein